MTILNDINNYKHYIKTNASPACQSIRLRWCPVAYRVCTLDFDWVVTLHRLLFDCVFREH